MFKTCTKPGRQPYGVAHPPIGKSYRRKNTTLTGAGNRFWMGAFKLRGCILHDLKILCNGCKSDPGGALEMVEHDGEDGIFGFRL